MITGVCVANSLSQVILSSPNKKKNISLRCRSTVTLLAYIVQKVDDAIHGIDHCAVIVNTLS